MGSGGAALDRAAPPTHGCAKESSVITIPFSGAYGVPSWAGTIGDGSSTDFILNHGLGTSRVDVIVRRASTDRVVAAAWRVIDDNHVKVETGLATPPATDEFVVVVQS